MTHEDHLRPRELRDDVVEIGDVVHEVVVAAGSDPRRVAVAALVRCDHVRMRRETLGDLAPPVPEVGEAVDEDVRQLTWCVPFERMRVDAGGEPDPAADHGPATIR
jgi:hypothetical protein